MEVLYGGNSVFDYQIESAIIHDAKLAIASGLMILILIFSLSGFSVWSTICGVYAILSCFPFAFFAYRVILQIESIGLLNVISLFVIIGIGVDDVFVFLNTFKQSASLRGLDTIHKRLTHTIISAGKATFFTSVTTAVAFFANAISSVSVQNFHVARIIIGGGGGGRISELKIPMQQFHLERGGGRIVGELRYMYIL